MTPGPRAAAAWVLALSWLTAAAAAFFAGVFCRSAALTIAACVGALAWSHLALPCVWRAAAKAHCLSFAFRVRVLRGGRLVMKPPRCAATFAVDFSDRVVYWPLTGEPRVYLKRRLATVEVPWEWC